MFTRIEIEGDQLELAKLLTKLEAKRWPGANESDFTRLVGTLGEMAACMFLDKSAGRASTMPLGLVHRMGLVSDQVLGRGDVCVVGKRKAARGRHSHPVDMLFNSMHEVKATTARPLRGMVKAEAVQTYHDHNVSSILLWFVRLWDDKAFLTLDSMAAPTTILYHWDRVEHNGVEYYLDPNIRRSQRQERAKAANE